MSLVLVVVRDEGAVVMSDGATSAFFEDGRIERLQDDNPKFQMLAPNLLIAATGSVCLTEDVIYPEARRFLMENPEHANTFCALADYLTAQLPRWHRETEEKETFLDDFGCAVALVGYDTSYRLVRCLFWNTTNRYQPTRMLAIAFGLGAAVGEASQILQSAYRAQAPLAAYAELMRRTIALCAERHSIVGGEVYSAEILNELQKATQ